MTEDERKEIENRAAIVVRGCTQPNSGWYNSPDDLHAVIEGQLAAVWLLAWDKAILQFGNKRKETLDFLAGVPLVQLAMLRELTLEQIEQAIRWALENKGR